MKKCSKCQIEKSENCFHQSKNKIGKIILKAACKECVNSFLRNKYQTEKNYHIQRNQQWAKNNPEKVAAIKKKYYDSNKENFLKNSSKWTKNNKRQASINSIVSAKKRYKKDPLFRLSRRVRSSIYKIAKALKQEKPADFLLGLGCSLTEFKIHIENQFQEGMTWENYGLHGWHIDHIIPIDFFIKNSDNPWQANHFSNLQPLWAQDNLKKSNSLPSE